MKYVVLNADNSVAYTFSQSGNDSTLYSADFLNSCVLVGDSTDAPRGYICDRSAKTFTAPAIPEISDMTEELLKNRKAQRITYSKTALAKYLASNPLTWTDGKQYSVTEDKQALLTGNIAAYQLAVTLGQSPDLTWNATSEECTVWTFENLAALAVAIKAYVKPLVAYQQAAEVAINACATAEEVEAVAVDYENA